MRTQAEKVNRTLWILVAATLVLYLGLAGVAAKTFRDARSNQKALCAVRADLEKRVTATSRYLVDHPGGFPGVPAKTLAASIRDQTATIKALSSVDC